MEKIYILPVVLVVLFVANIALAQPTSPVDGTPITLFILEGMVGSIAVFLIIVSALIIVIAIIWNGIKWTMAGDDTAKVKEAKDGLKATIIGAFVIFGVGVIIATITRILATGSFY